MKKYEEPKAEVIRLDQDVITASNSNTPVAVVTPVHGGGSND